MWYPFKQLQGTFFCKTIKNFEFKLSFSDHTAFFNATQAAQLKNCSVMFTFAWNLKSSKKLGYCHANISPKTGFGLSYFNVLFQVPRIILSTPLIYWFPKKMQASKDFFFVNYFYNFPFLCPYFVLSKEWIKYRMHLNTHTQIILLTFLGVEDYSLLTAVRLA